MPTLDWLRKEFDYGYDSGDILKWFPDAVRKKEEEKIGGSYRKVFLKAVVPYIKKDAQVLELGPGKGSWTRALLRYVPQGKVTTVDFQDVSKFLHPKVYNGRLECVQITGTDYSAVPDDHFDFFWSMGVLCHNNKAIIAEIMKSTLTKVKRGAHAVHQYGDWEKLEQYGWDRGGIPKEFAQKADDEMWWPRNTKKDMAELCRAAGWEVVTPDLNLVQRDSIIVLRRP